MESVVVPAVTGAVSAVLLLVSLDGRGPFARFGVTLRCVLPLVTGVVVGLLLQIFFRLV